MASFIRGSGFEPNRWHLLTVTETIFLARVLWRKAVRKALSRGVQAEEVAKQIGFDEFIGDRLSRDRNGMPQRHLNTVAKIVEEESGRGDNI